MGSLVQIQPDPPGLRGGVAQLGEHLLCKQGVIGSIPFTSTRSQRVEVRALPSVESFGIAFFNKVEEVQEVLFSERGAGRVLIVWQTLKYLWP